MCSANRARTEKLRLSCHLFAPHPGNFGFSANPGEAGNRTLQVPRSSYRDQSPSTSSTVIVSSEGDFMTPLDSSEHECEGVCAIDSNATSPSPYASKLFNVDACLGQSHYVTQPSLIPVLNSGGAIRRAKSSSIAYHPYNDDRRSIHDPDEQAFPRKCLTFTILYHSSGLSRCSVIS